MPEEKKELQNEDEENVSGGLSLEKVKKFASKHKGTLAGAGAILGATILEEGVFKGKLRKALFSQRGVKISGPKNARYGLTSPNAGKPLPQNKEDVARDISQQNEKNFYDESENDVL